jgi:hypothetical protein
VALVALVVQVVPVGELLERVPLEAWPLEQVVVEVAEPPSSRDRDHIPRSPWPASRNRCASRGCRMRYWCHNGQSG